MGNEGSYVALGLKTWNAQIDRADKLFAGLSSEEILREIAQAGTGFFTCGDISQPYTTRCSRYCRWENDFIPSLMSPSSRIPTNHEPTFLRTNKFAGHGTPSMLKCGRGLKQCLGPIGSIGTRPYRRKISPKILRAIASPSY